MSTEHRNNHVEIRGRLFKDADKKYTPSGKAVCSFSMGLAQSKNKSGEYPPPIYVDVTLWGDMAVDMGGQLVKGAQVAVGGFLTYQKWIDKTTNKNRSKLFVTANHLVVESQSAGEKPVAEDDIPW